MPSAYPTEREDEVRVDTGPDPVESRSSPAGKLILLGLVFAGVAATTGGILLWSARGTAVFMDVLASALAMCF